MSDMTLSQEKEYGERVAARMAEIIDDTELSGQAIADWAEGKTDGWVKHNRRVGCVGHNPPSDGEFVVAAQALYEVGCGDMVEWIDYALLLARHIHEVAKLTAVADVTEAINEESHDKSGLLDPPRHG